MKNKILTILFSTLLAIILIFNIFTKKETISYTERRKLKELPEITLETIFNGDIFDNLEDYYSDHFILRDKFRNLKANFGFKVLGKKDYNNLYIKDNYIYKIEYPLKENKVQGFTNKINKLYNDYLKDMNAYYSIIPDKNYYTQNDYLKLDYDRLFKLLQENLSSDIKYIDITKDLNIDNYYYTDIHWKQETLNNVVKRLSETMKFNVTNNYTKKEYKPFYGTYYGQLGLNTLPDKLIYLSNDTINNSSVKAIGKEVNKVYDENSLGKMDSYDVFLGGTVPIIEVTNNNTQNNKELIIFRDSFSSSIAPLLLDGYKKVTLIDLRYIDSSLLTNYISFTNQDILLLYNTTIINNSDLIKID